VASIRKRQNRDTWVVDYFDEQRVRHLKTFKTRQEAADWLQALRLVPLALLVKCPHCGHEFGPTLLTPPIRDATAKKREAQRALVQATIERRGAGATPAEIAAALDITPLRVRRILKQTNGSCLSDDHRLARIEVALSRIEGDLAQIIRSVQNENGPAASSG
jgi:hypothetical protein